MCACSVHRKPCCPPQINVLFPVLTLPTIPIMYPPPPPPPKKIRILFRRKAFPVKASLLAVLLSVAGTAQAQSLTVGFSPSALTVAVGGTVTAVLSLPGVPAGFRVTVTPTLSAAGRMNVQVNPASVEFTAGTQSHEVTITGLAVTGPPGQEELGRVRVTPIVDPTSGFSATRSALRVTVVPPPPVELQLMFEPLTLTVARGATKTAVLSLAGVPAVGAAVTVALSTSDERKAQVMPQEVVFDAQRPSRVVTVTGVALGDATLTAAKVSFGGLSTDSTVMSAELAVTVAPPPIHMALEFFSPPELTIVEGESEETRLRLRPNRLPAGVTLTVNLSVDGRHAAFDSLGLQSATRFIRIFNNQGVSVYGLVPGNTTVTAVADTSVLPPDSTVESAHLPVRVVPAPVHLALMFESSDLQLTVGTTPTVTLFLEDVPTGYVVPLELRVEGEAVQLVNAGLGFAHGSGSVPVTIAGVAAGHATVTAVEAGDCSPDFPSSLTCGLPPNSTVAPAQLPITVVEPPVDLALEFEPPSLELAVGAAATVTLRLAGVPEGYVVQVGLGQPPELAIVRESLPFPGLGFASVAFTSSMEENEITIEGFRAAENVALLALWSETEPCHEAIARLADTCGLPPDSTVEEGVLPVTVVPPPVHLQFRFDRPAMRVAEDETIRRVFVTLPDLPYDAEVRMLLSTGDPATVRIDSGGTISTSLVGGTNNGLFFDVRGLAVGSATITATMEELFRYDFGEPLPPDSTVADAHLPVTVFEPPTVHLQLAFEPTSLTVVVGESGTVRLSLLGSVPEGTGVRVVSDVAGLLFTHSPLSPLLPVTLDAETPSLEVTITGLAVGSATLTAVERGLIGLSEASTVQSAQLAVTVVPRPVHLQLAFDPPSLTVTADAAATAELSLLDVPAGASVRVALSSADTVTALVMSGPVMFTATTTSHEVTVEGVAAGSAAVTAEADISGLPPNSTVEPAELPVTVVPPPVDLQLAFDPSSLTVTAGATTTAELSLLDVPAGASVRVELSTADTATALVMSEPVVFTATATSREVTIEGVAAGSVAVMAEVAASGATDLPSNSTVMPAELVVTVVSPTVDLQLVFNPPSLTVTAGSETTATLSLSGVPAGAEMLVDFRASGEAVVNLFRLSGGVLSPASGVLFDAVTTSHELTLVGAAAGNATVTAVLAQFVGLSEASTVRSAQLAVTVVPAPVHLQLAFDPSSLTVTAGATTTAELSLLDVPAGASVRVELSTADTATALVMSEPVVFTATATSHKMTIEGVAAGSVAVTAVADTSGLPPNSSVSPAELPITVVPAPVQLALAFDPSPLTLEYAQNRNLSLSLLGVPAGATVTVTINALDVAIASVSPRSVVFTATMTSHPLEVSAGVRMGSVTVTAVADISDLPPDSSVASAQLPITVVPPMVSLQLAFDPSTLAVVAGAQGTVRLRLLGFIPAGVANAEVEVALSVAGEATVQVVPQPVVFNLPFRLGNSVTITGATAGNATVTAVATSFDEISENSTVASAELVVTVVPAPVHLQLAFDPTSLTVVVGSEERVDLILLGLSDMDVAGGSIEVDVKWSTGNAEIAAALGDFSFGKGGLFPMVIDNVGLDVMGVAEGTTALEAVATQLTGLPPNSTVERAVLPVTVVLPPVDLQLAFDPTSLTVTAGDVATATLRLAGVPAGFVVPVELNVTGEAARLGDATQELLSSFGIHISSLGDDAVRVEMKGVSAGEATLTARWGTSPEAQERCRSLFEPPLCGLPPNSTVEPAELVVTVVPAPIRLQLAFDPTPLTVVVDSERTAVLRLVGDVPEGATVTVALRMELSGADAAAAQVTPSSVVFDAQTPSRDVTVSGVAEGSAALTATVSEAALAASGLPDGSTVASVELPVTVMPTPLDPVTLTLAFDPMSLTVTAGREATAVLRLPDVPEGIEVTVTLSVADATTAQLVTESELRFSADTSSRDVTVLGVVAGNVTLTATVGEDALDALPGGSTVAPAELAVTVVAAPVHLQLAFDPSTLEVTAGREATVVLSLLGDVPEDAGVTMLFSSSDRTKAHVVLRGTVVVFDATTTNRDVTVLGVAAGNVMLTAVADTSGLPVGSTVERAELSVTVVPPPVRLALMFDSPGLTIVEGREGNVFVRLPDVPDNFIVPLGLSVEGAAVRLGPDTQEFLSTDGIHFSSSGSSHLLFLEGVSAGEATLTASWDTSTEAQERCGSRFLPPFTCSLPPSSTVASARLPITVVPPPVHLQLAFDPTSLTVTTGATAKVTLRLLGDVPEGAFVTAVVDAQDSGMTARPSPFPGAVLFDAATTSREVTIEGVAEGIATVTAETDIALDTSNLPPDSTVESAELEVTVVPPPVHLQLSFDPSTLTVVAGAQGTAQLRLVGDVPEGASVRVELSATDGEATVLVMPESVVFDADTQSSVVTVTGVAAGNVAITAAVDADDLADSNLPPNSIVASTELSVTVVPAPVELQLSFDSLALMVAAGAERTAVLSLPGVPTGAAVTVALSATNTAIAEVTPESVTFTADMQSSVVTVLGMAEGSATVTAVLDVSSGLPEGSTVLSAELSVTVVPAVVDPVMLRLVFAPTSLEVEVGAMATAVLRLLGDVPEGIEVAVTVGAADATTARVLSEPVIFSAGTTRHEVTIEGVVAGDVTVTAVADTSGLPVGSTVERAELSVTVETPGLRLRVRALLEGPLQ